MKKLILTLITFTLLAQTANAQVSTFAFGTFGVPGFDSYTGDADFGAVASYDRDGNLIGVQTTALTRSQSGLLGENLTVLDNAVKLKLFIPDGETVLDGHVLTTQHTPAPTPEATAEPEFSHIYSEELYETSYNALSAPAMIKSIKTAYEDDETVYKAVLLFHGVEVDFTFEPDFYIQQASDAYAEAIGENASYLKAGDVILLNYVFKDAPKYMCLLYRPEKIEPLKSDGADFLPLFTTENLAAGTWSVGSDNDISYHFGAVTDIQTRYISIASKSGKVTDISLRSDASVYSYDISDRTSAEISGTGGIYSSEIPDVVMDDVGNITQWTDGCERTYALVRTIDGVATDVLFFCGYDD